MQLERWEEACHFGGWNSQQLLGTVIFRSAESESYISRGLEEPPAIARI